MRLVYRVLEIPFFYRLLRALVPGGAVFYTSKIDELMGQLPPAETMVDVGCGPTSRIFKVDQYPIGFDINHAYMLAYDEVAKGRAVVSSADVLPIKSNGIDGVWCFATFHHLPDEMTQRAIRELMRVCKPGGYVCIFDMVLPRVSWKRPVATLIRRADRGKYPRCQEAMEALLPSLPEWTIERITYSPLGLEMFVGHWIKPS